jgi:hypothetical protein
VSIPAKFDPTDASTYGGIGELIRNRHEYPPRLALLEQTAEKLGAAKARISTLEADNARLRTALHLACGLLSTYEDHSMFFPDQLVQQFLNLADKEAHR